ncbi:MAG: ATP-binding cassette domain-containing protein [Victivallaceae bacterium]|nr:ATP-binding cassette domain-containing protein [Victivallaceae bacterium]
MIDFTNVEKNFIDRTILNSVSFRVNPGERVGLVGPNGAGKTTIFSMIIGELAPDKGDIAIPKRMRIGYLHQQLESKNLSLPLLAYTSDALDDLSRIKAEIAEIEHTLSVGGSEPALLERLGRLQTEFEHLGGYRLRNEAEAALCNLGFDPDAMPRPLSSFSGGWQMRAALARTLISDPDILLLDEPSNYLDVPAVEWLCKFLKSFQGTLLLISHDRFMLEKLTTVTFELDGGTVTRYNGNFSQYRREREARKLALENAQRNIDKQRKDLERNIERFRYKSSKASQAQAWIKQLDKLSDVSQISGDLSYKGAIRFPDPPPCGSEAVRFENVTFGYRPEDLVVEDSSFNIDAGEKVGFIGYNGTGKTTILKLLTGALAPQKGKVVLGHNIVVGYQAQEFADLLPGEMSVYDVTRAACSRDFPLATLPNLLGSFGFSGSDQNKLCKVLSGGEKIRLCFARIFVNPPNLLVLDEPTTHLDIAAREMLQKVVREYKGTVCFVSHDIEFVRGCADIIYEVKHRSLRKFYGNYDYYLEKSSQLDVPKGQAPKSVPASAAPDAKERRRIKAQQRAQLAPRRKKLEQEVASCETELETREARKKELIDLLSQGGYGPDYSKMRCELIEQEEKIESLSKRWEEAAEALEKLLAELNSD